MKIGVISPNALFRRALIALLAGEKDMSVSWQPADVHQAAGGEKPDLDVIVVDPGSDRLDRSLLEEVQQQFPRAKEVVLYELPSDELMAETILAGAHGCLSKVRDADLFLKAVRCVARGELWANRHVTAWALKKNLKLLNGHSRESHDLSRREWEVISLVAVGKRNRQIASSLHISEQTVKRHLYSVYRKLNVSNRLEACLSFYRIKSIAPEAVSLSPASGPASARGR